MWQGGAEPGGEPAGPAWSPIQGRPGAGEGFQSRERQGGVQILGGFLCHGGEGVGDGRCVEGWIRGLAILRDQGDGSVEQVGAAGRRHSVKTWGLLVTELRARTSGAVGVWFRV